MRQLVVSEKDTLLAFLYKSLTDMKQMRIKTYFENGCVAINGQPTTQYNHPLVPGDTITLETKRESHTLFEAKIKVVHEDEDIIVIDKPHGLLTVGTDKIRQNTAY